ncbi:MAG: BrnT family toxin, partial [Spirochaetales bacterium]|nr:BrnT family toxin [Spirochaetales bacterium]
MCEWDDQKNLLNIKKHHISFETASKVFLDPYFL